MADVVTEVQEQNMAEKVTFEHAARVCADQ